MRYVKALGLALVASLSLLALTASGAQGTPTEKLKGDWELDGQLITLEIKVNGSLYDWENSSMLVPDLNIAVRCAVLKVLSGNVLPLSASEEGRSIGHGEVRFKECKVYRNDNLQLLPHCEIFEQEEGAAEGEITAAALFHVVRTEANGTAYVLVEPSPGVAPLAEDLNKRVFADMYFGELCPLEGLIEVSGTLLAEYGNLSLGDPNTWTQGLNGPLLKETSHANNLLFGDGLVFGEEHAAFLDGEVKVFAEDPNHSGSLGVEAGS